MEIISMVVEPFKFIFFQKAIFVGLIIAVCYALLGGLVVARKEAIITHTLSSFSLLGIVIFAIFNLSLELGVYVGAIIGLLIIYVLGLTVRESYDAFLTFLAETSLAICMILLIAFKVTRIDLSQFLFGNILGLNQLDLILVALTALLFILFYLWQGKNLVKMIVSQEIAKASGLPVRFLEFIFQILLALVIAVGVRAVGGLLVSAMMVIPALTSRNLAHSLASYRLFGVLTSLFAVIIGIYSSYYLDIPTGPAIVVSMACVYILSLLVVYFRKSSK